MAVVDLSFVRDAGSGIELVPHHETLRNPLMNHVGAGIFVYIKANTTL